ncbi:hypothetical protein RRG08_042949 [Elysia crispata]|uniref:Uncharacterized protein n=1 Tax=Elysia crispata TaxID=231223 RepID=A0AAE1AYF3_9GAST|nr:hypothetical protein RRG08_042949 [Elysia crispata]
MRLARFNANAVYTSGKNLHAADTLSRQPLRTTTDSATTLQNDITAHVNFISSSWPASDAFLERIKDETAKDERLSIALNYTANGWPDYKEDCQLGARHLYQARSELSISDGLLLKGDRIIIPATLQKEVLGRIHQGHFGITKCPCDYKPSLSSANGAVERAVRTAKHILNQDDVFLALLVYRASPIVELKASPAELAYGRKLRTTLPAPPKSLVPKLVDKPSLDTRHDAYRHRQQIYYNHHGARHLPNMSPGDPVLVKLDGHKAPTSSTAVPAPTITTPTDTPPVVPADTPISAPDGASAPTAFPVASSAAPHSARSTTITRSGREVKIPVRFQ